ncbi:MAG: hypothetical protein ACI8RZ_006724 [Myxococcota bacterium]|jgi:hypothetical protein
MKLRKTASAITLVGAVLALIATSPVEPPEPPPSPVTPTEPEPPSEPEPTQPDATLSGRQVWMVNAPESDCAAAEKLGLKVTCEPERPGAAGPELVVWCPEISQATAETLLRDLSLEGFAVRTWESQPAEKNAEECGQFYEIVLRY